MEEENVSASEELEEDRAEPAASRLFLRSLFGGVLMGLANLVPGISGGTMLLAAGIYPRFIGAVAELSTLRIRGRSVLVLGSVVIAAAAAILLFAGTVKDLVVHHRWIMYSIFIGLTLGGVPVVWKLARPATTGLWLGALAGFAGMVLLAFAQSAGTQRGGEAGAGSIVGHALAGLAGASAMILPGVSGGYLLLVLGEYIPILAAIDGFKTALQSGDLSAAMEPGLQVLLPVGIGVIAGVAAVSSLLRWLLRRCEKPTLGVLLGLLIGAVVGLWPFQHSIEPVPGKTVIKGRVVTQENLAEFSVEDYPTRYFEPSVGQALGAVGFILLGALITAGIARLGSESDPIT
jgi:putative membrane protein